MANQPLWVLGAPGFSRFFQIDSGPQWEVASGHQTPRVLWLGAHSLVSQAISSSHLPMAAASNEGEKKC